MANPAGNYPGRQIFLGTLSTGHPAFAYFGSGRSAGSQGRYATDFIEGENSIRINPTDAKEKFDPFRHYQAVRIQPSTGLLVVSNSQAPVDAVYEAYWLGHKVKRSPHFFVSGLLRQLGPEYDSEEKPTSRIVGVAYNDGSGWLQMLGITDKVGEAVETSPFATEPGVLRFVPTYDGNVDYKNFDPVKLKVGGTNFASMSRSPQELAEEIYEMSDYVDPKYGELRVWCVAGVQNGNGPGGWELGRRNRHEVEE
ncbi:MAG: hypothetical protein QT00_C0001G0026 [archaeon GW2011_AR5]|nr:MAG: hypothetical protein QT00_C0001G0026 [archaeon GW2011_AR5]